MIDYQDIYNKFEENVLRKINFDNMNKILTFLSNNNVKYLEDIVNNYIDIFIIDYEEFVNKYNELNSEYNNELYKKINDNIETLELFL